MPSFRLMHNRVDMGERTSKLSDFEFRVWVMYRACSDDYGVCPLSAQVIQGSSRRLAHAEATDVFNAMLRLVDVRLCDSFEHQGMRYLCTRDWQDWEQIRYPRQTSHPAPPRKNFRNFSANTQKLFRSFHEAFQKSRGKISVPRARGRAPNANANANAEKVLPEIDPVPKIDPDPGEGPGEGPPAEPPEPSEPQVRHHLPSVAGLSPMDYWRKHGNVHLVEFCDFVCLPMELADSFARKVTGVPFEQAQLQVLDWARDIRQQWHGRIVPDGSDYDFWRHRWTETHGGSKPATSTGSPDYLAGIRELRRGHEQ